VRNPPSGQGRLILSCPLGGVPQRHFGGAEPSFHNIATGIRSLAIGTGISARSEPRSLGCDGSILLGASASGSTFTQHAWQIEGFFLTTPGPEPVTEFSLCRDQEIPALMRVAICGAKSELLL
jgi:hypothetical protein